jgi:uncharacterized membrane protein YhhN
MSTFKLQEKRTPALAWTSTGLFLAASIVFFLPLEVPHKVTFPVGILTLASLWLCPWQITLALLFSAAGDYFGSCGNFLGQMGSFALAHAMYIVYFADRYFTKVERDRKLTPKMKGYLAMVIFCILTLLAVVLTRIAPAAEPGIIRIGVIVYACLISAMMLLALLQRSSLFALGAVLFVFSDFILAWNMFVEPVPYRQYLVLVPYFLAQWLLFIRATPYRVAPEMRIMRF